MFPNFANIDQWAVGFALVFFRVAALMLFAPLFGSAKVPRRVKIMLALVMAMSMFGQSMMRYAQLPVSIGELTVGIFGEICLGIVMGQAVSLIFIAAQWAGEMVGQQIGLNMAEVVDPQFGAGGTIVSDLYFMLGTSIFLIIGGHRQLVLGIHASLDACPPLSIVFSPGMFQFLLGFLTAITSLALRLSAPMFVTMIVVDISMGCISKTMPALNVMSAGMSVRSMLGVLVLALGMGAVTGVLTDQLSSSLMTVTHLFVK